MEIVPKKRIMSRTLRQRFEEKFYITPGCWIWTAKRNDDGYGKILFDGKSVGAHRVSHEIYIGPIPGGMYVLHKCDQPRCVNPDHLRIGTHADNMADKVARNRNARNCGEKAGNSKLTEAKILAILSDRRTQTEIAKYYGVTQAQISRIKRRETWRHIPP